MSVVGSKVTCDRCGGALTNGAVTEAAVVSILDEGGVVRNLHFCLASDDDHDRCATRILTAKATDAYTKRVKGPLSVYHPDQHS